MYTVWRALEKVLCLIALYLSLSVTQPPIYAYIERIFQSIATTDYDATSTKAAQCSCQLALSYFCVGCTYYESVEIEQCYIPDLLIMYIDSCKRSVC